MTKKLNRLAVETSSMWLSVALRTKRGQMLTKTVSGSPRHSEQIISAISDLIKRAQISKRDIDEFVWGMGPGSFTGLRIGFSVLKAFALAFKKESFGVSSLDVLAAAHKGRDGRFAVCIDARRERIYTSIYERKAGKIKRILRDQILTLDEVCSELSSCIAVTGDALLRYGSTIRDRLGSDILFSDEKVWHPKAASAILIREDYPSWAQVLKRKTMVPRYLRRSEAEERYQERKKRK